MHYPHELEYDATTLTGSVAHVRPIRPGDGPKLARFHARLSPRSVYQRFFYVHPVLSPTEIEHFTVVDYSDRLALVAEEAGELVAVGRYERRPSANDAEVAFVVADQEQHQGIGTVLLERLAAAARAQGIATFTATLLFGNRDMLQVFVGSGYRLQTTACDGTIEVRFSITEDPHARDVEAHHQLLRDEATRAVTLARTFADAFPAGPPQSGESVEPVEVSEAIGTAPGTANDQLDDSAG